MEAHVCLSQSDISVGLARWCWKKRALPSSGEPLRSGVCLGEMPQRPSRVIPMNGAYCQFFGRKKQARVVGHSSYRRCVAVKCSKGYFRALSLWREGALGANPSFRGAFAARSLLPPQPKGAGGTPRPPPQNLFQGDEHMTSFIYKNCTVGEVTRISDLGFGFDILNERVQPILSLAFETRDDAEQARAEIARLLRRRLRSQGPH